MVVQASELELVLKVLFKPREKTSPSLEFMIEIYSQCEVVAYLLLRDV